MYMCHQYKLLIYNNVVCAGVLGYWFGKVLVKQAKLLRLAHPVFHAGLADGDVFG